MSDIADFEKNVQVVFRNKKYLLQALTHRSFINENPENDTGHNERLEFLGDAVLELVVTRHLYEQFPEKPEGEMTSLRAALVNADMLSRVALEIEMNDYLLLSRGEKKDTGRARGAILANAFEAFIGALYLDQGFKACDKFIEKHVLKYLNLVLEKKLWKDPKSSFQEEAQERVGVTPQYKVLKEIGPDHNKKFSVGVYIGADCIANGTGSSKQEAEVDAAKNALIKQGWG